jgi:hypothetical protein
MTFSDAIQKVTKKIHYWKCNLRLKGVFYVPANSCFGCADVQGHVSTNIINAHLKCNIEFVKCEIWYFKMVLVESFLYTI